MGRVRIELTTNSLKGYCSTVELPTPRRNDTTYLLICQAQKKGAALRRPHVSLFEGRHQPATRTLSFVGVGMRESFPKSALLLEALTKRLRTFEFTLSAYSNLVGSTLWVK